ncbi:hypothetical protein SOVF_184600 [Spinacia oleracea]|nr:hypothetical protein SOVF_184600 [Spinacia oleracea]
MFGFTRQYLFRFITQKKNSNFKLIQPQEDYQNNGNMIELEDKNDENEVEEEEEEEESDPILRFRFPTFEEFLQNNDNNNDVQSTSHSISCENSDDKDVHIETEDDCLGSEIDTIAKSSQEFLLVEEISKREFSSESNLFENANSGNIFDEFLRSKTVNIKENSDEMKVENVVELSEQVNDSTINEDRVNNGNEFPSNDEFLLNGSTNNEGVMRNGSDLPSEDESLVSDTESDTMAPSSESSFRSSFIDSLSDGFLSDIDFERAFEVDTSTEFGWNEVNLTKEALEKQDFELQNLNKGYEADDFEDEDEDEDILEELKKLESNLEGENRDTDKEHKANMETKVENEQNEEKQSSGEQLSSDSDEQNGLETQWEHQDLVEQLKMEIKKVRAIGLPTILEESESPKIMDDLKPWKIQEKYKLGGTFDELHMFYKSYKERMRKLDILNYQKMYAIGFLRLKDPLKSFSKNKISTPALATIVSLDCWPCKPKSTIEINQPIMKKFSRELESDLEMVYVGQMCLSWEFLRWQYGKALDLWETDPHGKHRYNEVADKFQTFQVLLTRFLEDECFQGPRVQNYVKNRCVQRNLLQVPLIRDDNTRDRKKERKMVSSKDAMTSLQLVETIEESIRILWRFIKADKDTRYVTLLKCGRSSTSELQNPADASLLGDIQSSLQKKEKKLKDLYRSGKCVLKKFQKHQQEEGSDNVLFFFSQVDLRLVSRVLCMPRITTEQLVWCNDKLNNIHLAGRKLHVESSLVMLFPCS